MLIWGEFSIEHMCLDLGYFLFTSKTKSNFFFSLSEAVFAGFKDLFWDLEKTLNSVPDTRVRPTFVLHDCHFGINIHIANIPFRITLENQVSCPELRPFSVSPKPKYFVKHHPQCEISGLCLPNSQWLMKHVLFFSFFLKTLIFLEYSSFIKLWEVESFHTPCFHKKPPTLAPIVNITHQNGHFLPRINLRWHIIIT